MEAADALSILTNNTELHGVASVFQSSLPAKKYVVLEISKNRAVRVFRWEIMILQFFLLSNHRYLRLRFLQFSLGTCKKCTRTNHCYEPQRVNWFGLDRWCRRLELACTGHLQGPKDKEWGKKELILSWNEFHGPKLQSKSLLAGGFGLFYIKKPRT